MARHPLAPTWPLLTLSIVTLSERGSRTAVEIRWMPYSATEEEKAAFEAGRDGMRHGCAGMFEQLEAYLAGTR